MVGDVKQSIYKFRQADPSLFIEKYNRFSSSGNESGLRIDLSQNFRSRQEVLSTTNYLFKHMMDEQVGEIHMMMQRNCILVHHMTKFHILFNYEHLLRQVQKIVT